LDINSRNYSDLSGPYDASVATWTPFKTQNSTGISMYQQSSINSCVSAGRVISRSLQINFVCDPQIVNATLINVTEVAICQNLAIVNTALACAKPTTAKTQLQNLLS